MRKSRKIKFFHMHISRLRKVGLFAFALILALATFGCDEDDSSSNPDFQHNVTSLIQQDPSYTQDGLLSDQSEIEPVVTPVPGAGLLCAIGIACASLKLRKQ